MADSAQGTSGRPDYKQVTDESASFETAADDSGARGTAAGAHHNATTHIRREAVPTRGQAAYPNIAASEAGPSGYGVNTSGQATGDDNDTARDQSVSSSDHRIPPQSPQQSEARRLHRETVERIARYYPVDSARAEVWDPELRGYRHPEQLAPTLPGQTLEAAHATTLTPIRQVLPEFNWEALYPAIPHGHLRGIPDNWVAERDLLYDHREARLEALSFEYDLHELHYRIYRRYHELRRHLYQ